MLLAGGAVTSTEPVERVMLASTVTVTQTTKDVPWSPDKPVKWKEFAVKEGCDVTGGPAAPKTAGVPYLRAKIEGAPIQLRAAVGKVGDIHPRCPLTSAFAYSLTHALAASQCFRGTQVGGHVSGW